MRYAGADAHMNEGVVLGTAHGLPAWKYAREESWRAFAPGVDGGIGEGTPGVTVHIQVPDLEATLAAVVLAAAQSAARPSRSRRTS
jgi:hypothetical protein